MCDRGEEKGGEGGIGAVLRPQSLPLVTATEEREGPFMPPLPENEREREREAERARINEHRGVFSQH